MDRLDALVVEQIPRLRRYARALTGSADRADELVQDCLERAWGRLHLWRRGSDLRAWLFTIMHNVHANQVRHRRRRPVLVTLDPEQDALAQPPAQEDALALRDLAAALAALPEEQRSVLLLVSVEELSYGEVATILDIPLGTVMSRLHRARERLRLHMAGQGETNQRGNA
jgi:RNA polymerase sigma-70 factor, ECF subfamily